MYKNEKGETISLKEYSTAKYKSLFPPDSTKGEGASVFKSIMDDQNLTAEERQNVCLAIGKAGTLHECNAAKKNPATLMRTDSGVTQFNAAYLKQYGKSYMEAVTLKSQEAIQNSELTDLQRGQAMINGYTSELDKLSKEAAEFMKVTSGVVKTAFPEQSDQLTARVLVNNLSLRGAVAATTQRLVKENITANLTELPDRTHPQTPSEIEQGKKARPMTLGDLRREVKGKIDAAGQTQLDSLDNEIASASNIIQDLTEELDRLKEQPFEQRVARQRIEQAKVKLEKLTLDRENHLKEKGPGLEQAKKEGQKTLEPYGDLWKPVERGTLANNGLLKKLNSTDGFSSEQVGEGELDINGYKSSLQKMATGKVPGMEIDGDIEVAAIDVDGVAVEVEKERLELEKSQKVEATLKQEEASKVDWEKQKTTFGQSQEKAQPELDKIATLEKQLDSLTLAKRQVKNPDATMEIGKEKVKVDPYKPSAGERIKAVFTKGGMETILEKKRENLVEQLDKLKMTVQLKTDETYYNQVTSQHARSSNKETGDAGMLKHDAEFYELARQQVQNAERTLTQDQNLRASKMLPLPEKDVEEARLLKSEGLEAMEKYKGAYHKHTDHIEMEGVLKKMGNVRDTLKTEHQKQEKALAEQQKQNQGTGKKVGDQVEVGEKVPVGQKQKMKV